jgi:hypothetical protein
MTVLSRHPRLKALAGTGFAVLPPPVHRPAPGEWRDLAYLDGHVAVLASATGAEDPRGFWEYGRPDKSGVWTACATQAPAIRAWVCSTHAPFGRVQVLRIAPAGASGGLRRDDNNRANPEREGWVVTAWLNLTDNPSSHLVLREDRDDPATERRVPLAAGSQVVVDTDRLWYAVDHVGVAPHYAVRASLESCPALGAWIESRRFAG